MGTILEFRVTKCERREEPSFTRTLGEIIIFPGVRIERHGAHERVPQSDDGERSVEARAESGG